MSAKEKIGDTILLDFYAKRVNKTKKAFTYYYKSSSNLCFNL